MKLELNVNVLFTQEQLDWIVNAFENRLEDEDDDCEEVCRNGC